MSQPIDTAVWSRRIVLESAAFSALALSLPRIVRANSGPVVEVTTGKLRGTASSGSLAFKGVPYGASPAGSGRFKAPRPADKWTGVREALAYGHAAPQGNSLLPPATRTTGISLVGEGATFAEDCLYLNVWTPALDNSKRPVLVWLHGGGFASGSGGSALYDGTNMARTQDVVVVTINHRLNVFGYLDLSQIAGSDYADSASAGLLDVVLALRWVKDNIERFGGDPGRVTIFGESGGGRKVSVLMAMPPAQGLFHRAVVQSGSALRMDTQAVASERAEKLFKALDIGPKQLDKLLALPADALLGAVSKATEGTGQFRPTTGAPSLPAHPFDPKAPAMSADVPMLIGTNLTEASFALGRDPRVLALDEAGVLERIKRVVPEKEAANVLATYQRLYPGLVPSDLLFRVITDRGYFLDSTIQAERKAELRRAPAFLYSFNWQQPLAAGRTHAPHGSEIAFVFNNVHLARGEKPEALAATMCAAWAAFARTGDPSTAPTPNPTLPRSAGEGREGAAALGKWPPYDATARPTMVFDRDSRIENDPRGEQRKLMLAFGSQQYASREVAPM
jgi:para-nitrobenzyl esterase